MENKLATANQLNQKRKLKNPPLSNYKKICYKQNFFLPNHEPLSYSFLFRSRGKVIGHSRLFQIMMRAGGRRVQN